MQNILENLDTWHESLPVPLRFDFTQLDKDISRETVSMYLHYYQCINMTTRPLLFHVVQKRLNDLAEGSPREADWRAGRTKTTVDVIERCVAAARDSVTMMAAAARQNKMGM